MFLSTCPCHFTPWPSQQLNTLKPLLCKILLLKTDLKSPKIKQRIDEDKEEAKSFGISGTPGFIVAGVTLKGAYPIESFEEIIERKVKK
ncbi:hypothetical protein EBT16_08695 [bacterium]|nr:hypothetical protein [bacterium]